MSAERSEASECRQMRVNAAFSAALDKEQSDAKIPPYFKHSVVGEEGFERAEAIRQLAESVDECDRIGSIQRCPGQGAEGDAKITSLFSMQGKKETYFIFEELRNANPMVLHRFIDLKLIDSFFSKYKISGRITKAVMLYEKETNFIFLQPHEFDVVAQSITDIFISDAERAWSINEEIISNANDLIKADVGFLEDILRYDDSSVQTLLSLWKDMEERYADLFKFTWIHNALDFKDNLFTTHIFNLLSEVIRSNGIPLEPNRSFVTLTIPKDKKTYFVRFENELKSIKKIAEARGIHSAEKACADNQISKAIRDITEQYGWLGFGFDGPPWSESHVLDMMLNKNSDTDESGNLLIERSELLQKLDMGEKYERIFELARKVIEGTELRKEAMFHYYYVLDALFEKLSLILDIPKKYLRYVYPEEIMLLDRNMAKILEQREIYHLDIETFSSSDKVFGSEAKRFFDTLIIKKSNDFDGKKLIGQTAYPGRVHGRVKIVNEKSDTSKIEDGDILVSIATNPELISAMKKAAAFVTDRGGITCHAAIVSRELRIPCIVGTKIATQVLKDGDMVEVDADNGIVRIINIRNERL